MRRDHTERGPVRSAGERRVLHPGWRRSRRFVAASTLVSVPAGGGAHPGSLVEVPAASFRMGDDSVWAYPGDGEAPVHDVALDGFRIDRYTVTNDAFAAFRRRDGLGHRRRTIRLVVRVRRPAPRRLPRHPRRRRGRVVAPGPRRGLAPPRRTALRRRRARRPSRGPRVVERRARVLPVDRDPPPDRGRVGVRRPGRARRHRVPVGRRPRTGR